VQKTPLDTAPLEGSVVRLVLATADEAKAMAAGETFDWFADGYPRQDDLDGIGMGVNERLPADDRRWGARHIIRRTDGLAVGSLGFFGPPDETGEVEIGYGLVESARRQGLITEAIALAVGAAEATGARVMAHTDAGNLPSQGALLKSGFVREDGTNEDGEWRYARPRP
jgi:RimJ/RimL family protein N-acetyltransferase